ncbi:SIR2 family protein [Desulfofalx alkaliphila]|uniref:SIR2 family protein n=1 Tax=Desulfofalx alkaliphila TaxID=105483 RepID=UPI000690A9CF|nr:SIR2 family protein [Desulfofalx alkaliphila]
MRVLDELAQEIKEKRIIPFVGAGISRNLGLPGWESLIYKVAEDLDYHPQVLLMHGDFLQIAEYHILKYGSKNRIAKIIDRNLRDTGYDISSSKAHEYLVKLNFPTIYTTNFDETLEEAFKYHRYPYCRIATLDDILCAQENVTQIVKFHGSLDHDETLVISESDYHNRLDMNGPIDIKLRSDLLGKTVLFLGYSFRDLNVRYMWSKLFKIMKSSCKAYMVTMKPNPVFEEIYGKKGMRIICLNSDNHETDFVNFMKELYERVNNL